MWWPTHQTSEFIILYGLYWSTAHPSLWLLSHPKAEVSSSVDTRDGELWSAKSETLFSSLQMKTKLGALFLGRTGVCFKIAIGTNMYQWIWYFSESTRRVLGKDRREEPCFWVRSREIYNDHERDTGILYLVYHMTRVELGGGGCRLLELIRPSCELLWCAACFAEVMHS